MADCAWDEYESSYIKGMRKCFIRSFDTEIGE